MVSVGDRVLARSSDADASPGVPATVVVRVDRLFVDIEYDEPQPGVNYAGQPYTHTSACIHVALLAPIDVVPLW